MTKTAIIQASITPLIDGVKKNIFAVAEKSRANEADLKEHEDDLETHRENDKRHFTGVEKTALLKTLKWEFGSMVAQWAAIGMICLFLILGDQGREFLAWIKFWK